MVRGWQYRSKDDPSRGRDPAGTTAARIASGYQTIEYSGKGRTRDWHHELCVLGKCTRVQRARVAVLGYAYGFK